jgi:hypothetical protein
MPNSTENSETCTHERRGFCELDRFGKQCNVRGWGQHVFLKAAIFSKAGKPQFSAKKFIRSKTLRTGSA